MYCTHVTKHPKMTKAHFEYLAGLMNEIRPTPTHSSEYDQWERTVLAMGIALTWTNPNFDRYKFAEACGA
jgi:hypothetical protein